MSKKRRQAVNKEEETAVKLKPFLGMQPGFYLTVLYGIILILILFLVLFVPGIAWHGSKITFNSFPDDSAVYIDGAYTGSTPFTVFVKSGGHLIEVKKPFYRVRKDDISVEGKIFASLFAPRKMEYSTELSLEEPDEYFALLHREYNKWSLIDSFYPSYQPQPVLHDAVSGMLPLEDTRKRKELIGFLESCMAGTSNQVLLRDLLSSYALAVSNGRPLGPAGLIDLADRLIFYLEEYDYFPFWIVQMLPDQIREIAFSTEWFEKEYQIYLDSLNREAGVPSVSGNTVTLGNTDFIPVSSGNYIRGFYGNRGLAIAPADILFFLENDALLPRYTSVDGFYCAATEVTKSQFSAFLEENSRWKGENLDRLQEENLVTEDYLKNWSELAPENPVVFISYFAAEAYCQWMESLLPSSLQGYHVRLPREHEWEWAALSPGENAVFFGLNRSGPADVLNSGINNLGIYGLMGNVWEWCDNWFFPSDFLASSRDGGSNSLDIMYPGAEKAVRGGSWANEEQEILASTRASQPPSWCTPFLGFRPVLVKE